MRKTDRSTYQKRLDELLAHLRSEILSERRRAGELLPTESQLSEQFNLSRKSVRSALQTLEGEGYIQKIPNVGNKVLEIKKDRVTIRMGYYKSLLHEMNLEQLVERFQSQFPRIQVQWIALTIDDYCETAHHYIQSGMIDLLTINHNMFLQFQERYGCSAYFQPFEDSGEHYPFLIEPFREHQQLLAMPLIFSPVILCYNKEHFAEIGLSEPDSAWTWENVMENAKLLGQREDRYGFYYHLMSETRWPVFLLQNNVRFEQGDGYCLCRPEFKQSLEYARDLLYGQTNMRTFILQSENDAEYLFRQGKASMIMTTYFNLNRLKDCPYEFDIAPLPTNNEFRTLLINIGIAVNKQSPVKEEAMQLARFLAGPEAQTMIREQTFSLPSLKKVAETAPSPVEAHVSRYSLYREIMPTFRYSSSLQIRASDFERMRKELRLYWSKLETLDQFCERMQEEGRP